MRLRPIWSLLLVSLSSHDVCLSSWYSSGVSGSAEVESPLAFAVSPASSSHTLALSRTGPWTNLGLTRSPNTGTDTDMLQRPVCQCGVWAAAKRKSGWGERTREGWREVGAPVHDRCSTLAQGPWMAPVRGPVQGPVAMVVGAMAMAVMEVECSRHRVLSQGRASFIW